MKQRVTVTIDVVSNTRCSKECPYIVRSKTDPDVWGCVLFCGPGSIEILTVAHDGGIRRTEECKADMRGEKTRIKYGGYES